MTKPITIYAYGPWQPVTAEALSQLIPDCVDQQGDQIVKTSNLGIIAITVIVIAFACMMTVAMVAAKPAPTPTPVNQNHCMMLESGICYIVYPENCVPGTPQIYGPESMGVPVECE